VSLNKVLNRPLFRKAALKKGHLKTINAQTGIMVGQPTTGAPVPALRKPPTFFERMSVSAPARFAKSIFNIPFAGGYYGGEKVAEGLGIKDPLLQMPFGMTGGYLASKALPGLASLPAATSAALIAGPAYLTIAGAKERERIANMSKEEREAHMQKSRQFGTEGYLTDDMFEQQFGKFVPKAPDKVETRKSANIGPGSGRVGFSKKKKEEELKQEGDQLLSDNVVTSDNVANLDTVQENSLIGGSIPPGEEGGPGFISEKDKTTLTTQENKKQKAEDTKQTQNQINVGGISNDADFNKTIELAKKYYDEVYEGRGSQANLVFLANLASGLLTGTTRKQGIGGAMEVLGQALGPAVNNFATIKLKEGELRQNAREASLNAAIDHMQFLNENAKAADPERSGGVVQIRGVDGKLRNYKGYQLKNGTIQIAAGIGEDGKETFTTVSQGTPIKDSGPDGIPGNEDDRVIGQFEDFKLQKTISSRLTDLHDILGNRYDALATAREVLSIIGKEDAKAGAALSVDTFTRRLLGVGKELFGGSTILDLDSEMANLQQLYKDEVAALDRALAADEITESEYENSKKALELGDFKKGGLLADAKERILENSGKKGFYSNLSREDQETLAVYETKLVYALANTFKDQDRLTQRDINAAKEIVNIFSLSRSSADVRASIQAIARGLESDIRRQESLFTAAGGLERTLQDLRKLKDFTAFESSSDIASQLATDLGIDDIKKELENVEL
tara:strand:+ start:87 stop:2294 length:2208 start_codon:yes stop_codon:yes gene_type:complete